MHSARGHWIWHGCWPQGPQKYTPLPCYVKTTYNKAVATRIISLNHHDGSWHVAATLPCQRICAHVHKYTTGRTTLRRRQSHKYRQASERASEQRPCTHVRRRTYFASSSSFDFSHWHCPISLTLPLSPISHMAVKERTLITNDIWA